MNFCNGKVDDDDDDDENGGGGGGGDMLLQTTFQTNRLRKSLPRA
jgi:hypothetical protein